MDEARRARYDRLSAALASHSDLAGLVENGSPGEVGIGGGSATFEVAGARVFAKRIPLTDRELAHPRSTANLFGLPTFCQYGVGSPGFGAWRELAANQLVTQAARAGGTGRFPVLLHWQMLPGRPALPAKQVDVEAWGGSSAVRARLEELAAATHSLVLFLEFIPHPLLDWLNEDPLGRAETLEQQLMEIASALRGLRLLHMDGHFANLRTDGTDIYLADFGLATSPRFELSPAERLFAEKHVTHDAAYASMRLVNWVVTAVCGVPMAERNEFVRRCAAGRIPGDVPPRAAAIMGRHAARAALMNSFYWNVFGGDLGAEYPAAAILSTDR